VAGADTNASTAQVRQRRGEQETSCADVSTYHFFHTLSALRSRRREAEGVEWNTKRGLHF
jgi:hypothetical protein